MKAHSGLILYKRHNENCAVHKTRVPLRAQRFWMECDCQIWMVGRMPDGAAFPRQATGCTDLKAAEAVRESLLAQYTVKLKGDSVHGPTIAECVEKFIASKTAEVGERTIGQHRLLLERLQTFCATRGALYMRDLNVDLLETFKVEGLPRGLADTSKAKAVEKLRCFLRDAYRRGWITEPLVEKVTAYKAVYEEKSPYTEEEVEKLLNGAGNLNGGTHGYAKHPKTFRLLLELILETGMRVGDAVHFNPAVLVKGEHLWIYSFLPQKQKRSEKRRIVEAYIPDRLKTAIDACEWLSPQLPFAYGNSRNPSYLANEVYERMKTVGARCGVTDCRPHRLRDTFAVRKLLAGFQLDDVSRLLGHSSVKITETYYAKWVDSRKRRLERLVAESLVNSQSDALRD